MHTDTHMQSRGHRWKTGHLWGVGSLPHYADPRDWTQPVKLVSKCFYLVSHLTGTRMDPLIKKTIP